MWCVVCICGVFKDNWIYRWAHDTQRHFFNTQTLVHKRATTKYFCTHIRLTAILTRATINMHMRNGKGETNPNNRTNGKKRNVEGTPHCAQHWRVRPRAIAPSTSTDDLVRSFSSNCSAHTQCVELRANASSTIIEKMHFNAHAYVCTTEPIADDLYFACSNYATLCYAHFFLRFSFVELDAAWNGVQTNSLTHSHMHAFLWQSVKTKRRSNRDHWQHQYMRWACQWQLLQSNAPEWDGYYVGTICRIHHTARVQK